MNTINRSVRRWRLIAGYLGVVTLLLACTVLGKGTQSGEENSFQLQGGEVKVQGKNGGVIPIASESTFELTGKLESTDPWAVAGTILATNDSTQIEDGLQIGDFVRVKGAILEDETWLAYSIEVAEEQTDPIIILIGVVDSIDPWVVNGLELTVTEETIIQGEITPGMVVRVEILLLPDGTWEAISITPIGEFTGTSGCVTVIATVVSVNGNEIQFLGWPEPVVFKENGNGDEGDEAPITANQVVLVVVCISENGQLVVVQIIVLKIDGENGNSEMGEEKVLICHKPNKKGGNTLSISSNAVPAHLAHGDKLGPCP